MSAARPELFTWRDVANPRSLSLWALAPDEPGFYELGFVRGGRFEPRYGGRASGLTLRERLRQHWERSHNPHVWRERKRVSYRCKPLPSDAHARYVEAHYLAAFDYPWNQRQEWSEMFAIER